MRKLFWDEKFLKLIHLFVDKFHTLNGEFLGNFLQHGLNLPKCVHSFLVFQLMEECKVFDGKNGHFCEWEKRLKFDGNRKNIHDDEFISLRFEHQIGLGRVLGVLALMMKKML